MNTIEYLSIPRTIWDDMVRSAERTYPQECAGLVGQTAEGAVTLHPTPPHRTTDTSFVIGPDQLIQLRRQQIEVIGIYHSHPDAPSMASSKDRAAMQADNIPLWPNVFWCILSVCDAQCIDLRVYLWNPTLLDFDAIQVPWPPQPKTN